MLKKAFSAGVFFVFLAGVSAAAQDAGRFDASVAFGGAFSHTSSNSIGKVSVETTNSGLLLGSFRFRFNRTHGIVVNVGRTIDSQIYVIPPDNYRVQAKIMEYSGAYMISPFHFEKVQPFLFAGGGALRFSPEKTYIDDFQSSFGAANQTSKAFLYGGGVDYPVWKFLGIRLQYRGLVYKEPTFHSLQFFTGATAHMPEASIGVVYKF
jgi:opacity protein-like surface antigen